MVIQSTSGEMSGDLHPYSQQFASPEAVQGYLNKFTGMVDQLRHRREVALLCDLAEGDLFDCSIGTGRFIDALPNITSYAGMDYSQHFVDYVRATYPHVKAKCGDLLTGVSEPNSSVDSTICIRTLFAFETADEIIGEMFRITRPGGKVMFDYGFKPEYTRVDGTEILTSSVDIGELIRSLPVARWRSYPLDGALVFAKTRRSLNRLVSYTARSEAMTQFWLLIEKLSLHFKHDRYLYVLTRA